MSKTPIEGTSSPQFQKVADAFAANFVSEGDIGASVAVFKDGEPVVDLWGGHADSARTKPWQKDTLVNVWSSTKGMMALCVARANDQGLLSNNEKVAHYWPAFGANGKADVTVAQLFSHQAGLPGPNRQLSEAEFLNTELCADLLASQAPAWPIGSRSGYHALSIGPLADGLFQRAIGKTVGQYFRDELGQPLGIDFHMGLPESEDYRVAEVSHDGNPLSGGPENFNEHQHASQILMPTRPGLANLRAWRAQGMPSAAGQGNARSLARVYSALATDRRINGVELVSEKALTHATTLQIENEDLVLRFPVSWGVGFALNKAMGVYGSSPRAFGHHGWGGSFAFADPDQRLSVAYAMNFMREPQGGLDPRFAALVGAVYAAL